MDNNFYAELKERLADPSEQRGIILSGGILKIATIEEIWEDHLNFINKQSSDVVRTDLSHKFLDKIENYPGWSDEDYDYWFERVSKDTGLKLRRSDD